MYTLSIADTVEVVHRHPALLNSVPDNLQRPLSMMQRRITRLKALSRRSNIRMPNIGEYGGRAIDVVLDYTRTELVRRAFEAKREIRPV